MNTDRDNKGRFKQGNKGKPKGAIDKKTRQVNDLIVFLTEDGADKFREEISELEGEDYIKCYLQLLEYVMPKLARQSIDIEHSGKIDNGGVNIKVASEADIKEVQKLINGN